MSETHGDSVSNEDVLRLSVDIVAAYVGQNRLPSEQISTVINTVYASLRSAGGADGTGDIPQTQQKPAVPIRRSITPDAIICLEDGKRMKMLKRHLRTVYDMTPQEYRTKWGLSSNYPMVAPSYSKKRSQFAKKIGLGKGAPTKGPSKKSAK